MSPDLVLPENVLDTMIAWCEHGAPWEACGLLGARGHDDRHVTHLWPCTNAAQSSSLFRIAQADLVRVVRSASDQGLQVIGAWHSHLASEAVPSAADLALAPVPGWVQVIVSLYGVKPVVRAWEGKNELRVITPG